MAASNNTIQRYKKYVIPCYNKVPVAFARGRGARLWNERGHEYLDFFSGWAVSNLGHCHAQVRQAIRRQASRLIHVPNNFYHAGQAALAEKIIRHAFPGKVFFCNSGAEAVEAGIKLVRAYGYPKRTEIITMQRSFHGRTSGAMSATGQAKVHQGIKPLLGGFKTIPFNHLGAFRKAISRKTAAVILELVQGEGGVNIADVDYVRGIRRLCTQKKILMVVDEVQTGMGRTGKMFCFEHYGIRPDVMLLAKSLGGGFPMGALVAARRVSDVLKPGMHATTFGGSPLACAAGLSVFDSIEKEKLLPRARVMSAYLTRKLKQLKQKHSKVRDVRGKGLMLAMELSVPGQPVYDYCLKNFLLINVTQGNVLRFAPPLNIRQQQIDRAIHVLDKALSRL